MGRGREGGDSDFGFLILDVGLSEGVNWGKGLRKKGGRFKAAGGRGSSHDFALHVPILLLKKYVFR